MKLIFITLIQINYYLPIAYLVSMFFGLGLPVLYTVLKKTPHDIRFIWKNSKNNDIFALITIFSFAFYVIFSLLCIALVLFK
jgi:hypothetical protein